MADFSGDIFKYISLIQNCCILIQFWVNFVGKGQIVSEWTLVTSNRPLPESILTATYDARWCCQATAGLTLMFYIIFMGAYDES